MGELSERTPTLMGIVESSSGVSGGQDDTSIADERRAWTIKGIRVETVEQSRKAAQTQGMLLSLWVEKQLRSAAERELNSKESQSLAADIMCTKIDSVESALKEYLGEQEKRIAQLQEEVRNISNSIVPTLLKVLSEGSRKRA